MNSENTVIENSAFSAERRIGQVFTPIRWARWAISHGPYQNWLAGGTVLDPTGGDGVFLDAFLETATAEGHCITDEMLGRLYMVELDRSLCATAVRRIRERFGITVPESNIVHQDFFTCRASMKFTSVVGNPPWANFTDLPEDYKQAVKPYFIKYGLVPDRRRVLWGNSRIDLAAAIVAKCLDDHCEDGAAVVMFLPLSIFMNDGAHQAFRDLSFREMRFGIEEIHDLTQAKVFESISTRYCLAKLRARRQTMLPISYWAHSAHAEPVRQNARPLCRENNSLVVGSLEAGPVVRIPQKSRPRQGVNTCGANRRYFFDSLLEVGDGIVALSNSDGVACVERELVFPLITGRNFGAGQDNRQPRKFIFLPYDPSTARPLDEWTLASTFPAAWKYLLSIADELKSRKGKMLRAQMAGGRWWAMLGVGEYTFAPYKIVWQAYGRSDFQPQIFTCEWIPNQSLQAYMPFQNHDSAVQILQELTHSNINDYLQASQTAGTASWAQPGRIKSLLEFSSEESQRMLFED